MTVAGIHHFDLVISSLDRSLPLYREMLEPLGYTDSLEITGEQGERVVYLEGPGKVAFSLREARVPGEYDRYRIGIHHVAFEAPSREMVDDRFDWAKDAGLEIESEPRDYDYVPEYYAVFFYDPDGIKLEIVHAPED
jgi:catechol 2,3-dioxygenase-like lactoylglutathione lyase family enzyme